MNDNLSTLLKMRDEPYRWARQFKERTGKSVVGYFCSYLPDELICAAGALPLRVIGDNKQRDAWGGHLQNYCCSLSRVALDMALTGEFDFIDGFIYSHTCDTMQRLSDIWRINTNFDFHADLVLPVRLEGEAALSYLLEELKLLRSELESRFGSISDEDITNCMRISEESRSLLRRLYELKAGNPGILSSADLLWLVTSSSIMDKAEHNRLLGSAFDELGGEKVSTVREEEKVPLFGIGSIMDQWAFLDMLENSGGTIIDDDFCNGGRYINESVPDDDDPLKVLAGRMLGRIACPCKHRSDSARSDMLMERIQDSGAKGVLFFLLKYCDPHSFEYPQLKRLLDEVGIPSLLIEAEHGSVSLESLRTRVDALLETIKGS